MVDINSTTSIITLNVNGLNASIKRDFSECIKNMTHLYAVYKKPTLDMETHMD